MNLAVLGIGKLILLDYGSVDWYNIYRQPLFGKEDVYKTKVQAVADKLSGMGKIETVLADIEIPCLASDPDKDSIIESLEALNLYVRESDLVVGALDIFSGRGVGQILAKHNGKPFVSGAVDAWCGKANLYVAGNGGCYCCGVQPGNFADGGACTLATIEAQKIVVSMTTKYAVDCLLEKPVDFNEVRYLNGKMEFEKNKVMGSQKCLVCGENGLNVSNDEEAFEFIYTWLFGKV
jgi:molybdopterin/thiamine biosynthesis adenylyltransferase